jgi:hypothetical protein
MTTPPPLNRRRFLQTSTATTAIVGVWGSAVRGESPSPNEKLAIACVGTANRASSNISGVAGQNIVALCDIDAGYLNSVKARFPEARGYSDYRELLDKEGDKIDAVVVSTADHHHAPASVRAIRLGKHVYCEKPLTHTIEEARILAEEAAKHGVATQMGTQIHAGDNYRRVVEIIRSGAIGDVSEVHVWVGKGWGGGERPADGQKPPASLAWDLWLGPAPQRDYAAGRYHPAQWRRWWDFGQGTLGDMGCHYMDLPFWALDLRHPTRCEAEGPPVHAETCPLGLIARYDFPATDNRPALKFTWYDGNMTPRQVAGHAVRGSGVMFIGSEGQMFADYGSYKLYPEEKFAGFTPPEKSIPRSPGHYEEWITACKTGSPTTCNFDYSGALTEAVLLGHVAYRVGQPIQWDAGTLTAVDCPAAAPLIRKAYRTGWDVRA